MKRVSQIILAVAAFLTLSCSSGRQETGNEEDILVSVGDSSLYLRDVERQIPFGLTPEDSIEMFRNIVDNWVESRTLQEVAKENVVDLERINRLVEEYRNRLIVEEYVRKMGDSAPADVSQEEIRAYYRQYGDSMMLEQPLVKGIFIRTSERDPELDNIRKWIASGSPEDIDNLEKRGLREATGYEYFSDRWVEWDAIGRQIPLRVENPDSFLTANPDFETSHAGWIYLLHVSDFVPSGQRMPEDYALRYISEILADRRKGEYLKKLKRSIYNDAIKQGKLRRGSYDYFQL